MSSITNLAAIIQGGLRRIGVIGPSQGQTVVYFPEVKPIIVAELFGNAAIDLTQAHTLSLGAVGSTWSEFTAGEQTTPAANTRLADTGALPVGDQSVYSTGYDFMLWLATPETNSFHLKRRNAGDTSDLWSFRFPLLANTSLFLPRFRAIVNANERIVLENITAGVAGIYQAIFWLSPSWPRLS